SRLLSQRASATFCYQTNAESTTIPKGRSLDQHSPRIANGYLDTLELEVEGTLTTRLGNTSAPPTFNDIHYTVRIGSPESRETIVDLQRSVEAVCPIYNMLKNPQPIAGSIVRGPYSEETEREQTK